MLLRLQKQNYIEKLGDTNKDKILLSVYLKYKEKILPRFLIFSILKIDSKTIKNLNKELFKLKPLEEQKQIRAAQYKKIKEKYNALSPEKKKIHNRKRIERRIKKIGYENYKLYCNNMYKKWYNNLSIEKKQEYSNKQKERYSNLSDDIKQKYKDNKKNRFSLFSNEEKQEKYKIYMQNRKKKIKILSEDERNIYYEKLKFRKKIYFDNITIEKRKVLNKIRNYKRQLDKNKITEDEYKQKKTNIIQDNIIFM